MEWLVFIQMICSSKVEVHPANCEKYYTECVEHVAKEPEAIKLGYTKDTVAAYLFAKPKKRKSVCSY